MKSLHQQKLYRSNFIFYSFLLRIYYFIASVLSFPKTKHDIANILVFSPSFYRKYVFSKYKLNLVPNPVSSSSFPHVVPQLRSLGLCKLSSKALAPEFLEQLCERYPLKSCNKRHISSLSVNDDLVKEIISTLHLFDIIDEYYLGSSYLREAPTVNYSDSSTQISEPVPSNIFHSDGYRQVSVMILLNDIDLNSVHMQYALCSHIQQQPTYMREFIKQDLVASLYSLYDLVGAAGSVFIFDTEGLHRGCYPNRGTARLMLHLNFNPGTYPMGFRYDQ